MSMSVLPKVLSSIRKQDVRKFMCIVYVYDLIFWARNEDDIHDLEMEFQELCVELEQEDGASIFLGVTLKQDLNTGLIDIKQTGIN